MKTIIKIGLGIVIAVVLWSLLMPIPGPHKPGKKPLCLFDLSSLNTALTQYQIVYTNYPIGNRVEKIICLLGNNPRKIQFINIKPSQLNSNGEFLDPWDTPYEIKFESPTNFILRSAGSNRQLGDADDIIFNSASNNFVKP